ncbi:MAG: CotH kinase family protein [Verrucomicrobiales bacterium]|nr:CotH kinase family protein [Verrucomicrobiales bacterium]
MKSEFCLPAHRKDRRSVAFMLAAILSLPFAAMAADSAKAKAKDDKGPKSAGIKFSQNRGLQTAPFQLQLGPAEVAGEIRYTLDGTAPTAQRGEVYSKPIPVKSTSIVRAAVIRPDGSVSRPQTHTYLYLADVIQQSPDGLPPAGWPYSWGDNMVDYGMDAEVVNHEKYRDQIIPALQSLPIYSLVMDLDDLFGEPKGIYANSGQSGRDWERPASVELIRPDGKKGFQEDCGVRIRGGFSSNPFNPKHAFRLFFRKEYGSGKLKYPVFGPDAAQEFDSFDLRCPQNYSWSLGGDVRGLFVRDQFARDLQKAMGQPAARGDFCHLFINGQYWGLYDTCERPEASYASTYFGGKDDDYDVIKTSGIGGGGGFTLEATDGTIDAWKRLHAAAKEDLSSNAAYFKLLGRKPDGTPDPAQEVLLDPTNLVDYMLVIWHGGNLDSPVTRFSGNRAPNNWHALRNRTSRDGFKFFVWDAEHTLLDVEEDRTGPFPAGDVAESSHPQWLFQRCMQNAEFRVLAADRIQQHFGEGGVLSSSSALALFKKRIKEIEQAVIGESARWGDTGGGFPFGPPGGEQRKMRLGADGQQHPYPRTRDVEWRAEVRRIEEDYLPKRSEIVLFQMWRQGFVSDVSVPRLKPGSQARLAFDAAQGEIWYTLDGEDPRQVGGKPSPSAKSFNAEVPLTTKAAVTARCRFKDEWGPLVRVAVAK